MLPYLAMLKEAADKVIDLVKCPCCLQMTDKKSLEDQILSRLASALAYYPNGVAQEHLELACYAYDKVRVNALVEHLVRMENEGKIRREMRGGTPYWLI